MPLDPMATLVVDRLGSIVTEEERMTSLLVSSREDAVLGSSFSPSISSSLDGQSRTTVRVLAEELR